MSEKIIWDQGLLTDFLSIYILSSSVSARKVHSSGQTGTKVDDNYHQNHGSQAQQGTVITKHGCKAMNTFFWASLFVLPQFDPLCPWKLYQYFCAVHVTVEGLKRTACSIYGPKRQKLESWSIFSLYTHSEQLALKWGAILEYIIQIS